MAQRPVFLVSRSTEYKVDQRHYSFSWHSGMAPIQKKKNISELHSVARSAGLYPLLEVSSKSEHDLGRRLSAFTLKVNVQGLEMPLENAFQGSKVFTGGGPYHDLYTSPPGSARRDERLRTSGRIIGFRLGEKLYPSEPPTGFYDWLYANALHTHLDWLRPRVQAFAGYTDIEFNPEHSLNCQARSFALLQWLDQHQIRPDVYHDYWAFTDVVGKKPYWRIIGVNERLSG